MLVSTVAKVQEYLDRFNMGLQAIEFTEDTHSSELAAQALGVEVGQIAKSLLFFAGDAAMIVVTSGDMKVQSKKFKELTGKKPRFAPPEEVEKLTGFPPGGVCPVALKTPLPVFVDKSLERFDVVYAAAGTPKSALPVTVEQLLKITGGQLVDLA